MNKSELYILYKYNPYNKHFEYGTYGYRNKKKIYIRKYR